MRIFISSVQKEMFVERRAVNDFIESDLLLRRFFTVFLFENLPAGDQPTNAAILLFGRDPQRFLPAAEVRCMHFHGIEIREQTGVVIRTASRDLEELVKKELLEKIGATGRSTFYVLSRKLDRK